MLKLILVLGFFTTVLSFDSKLFIADSNYYVSKVQASYFQAFASCKGNGWTLVTAHNIAEDEAINATLATNSVTHGTWLAGFFDQGDEFLANWIWLDNGQALSYKNWSPNQPNTPLTTTDYCLVKYGSDTSAFQYPLQWGSLACSSKYFYICQDSS